MPSQTAWSTCGDASVREAASTSVRVTANWVASRSPARLCRVMSRAMNEAPATVPSGSRRAETFTDTFTALPSLRTCVLSYSITPPRRITSRISDTLPTRSGGLSTASDRPCTSWAR
jgi:hypothetical protein